MTESSRYAIPVPEKFRCSPLTRLPWGLEAGAVIACARPDAEAVLAEKVKKAYGMRHCILTDSARSALALYLRAAELQGEIILPSLSYTPMAAVMAGHGLSLQLCDMAEDFCPRLEDIERAATPASRAVYVTHMFGRVAPIDQIRQWADSRGIPLISNLVHLPGGIQLNGQALAAYSDAALLSFNMDKPLHALYGGALLTNSDELAAAAFRLLKDMPRPAGMAKLLLRALLLYRYKPLLAPLQALYNRLKGANPGHDEVARTYDAFDWDAYRGLMPRRIHPVQAAVALRMVDQMPEMAERKRALAGRALALFKKHVSLVLPREDTYPHSYHYFPVMLPSGEERYRVGLALARRGIEAKWRYYPLHLQSRFRAAQAASLEKTAEYWKRHLLLPVPCGSPADVEYIAKSLDEVLT